MTGLEMRFIMRTNNVRNHEVYEKIGVSRSTLNKVLNMSIVEYPDRSERGNAIVPPLYAKTLSEIVGVDLTNDSEVQKLIEAIPEHNRDNIFLDNRRFIDRSLIAIKGSY